MRRRTPFSDDVGSPGVPLRMARQHLSIVSAVSSRKNATCSSVNGHGSDGEERGSGMPIPSTKGMGIGWMNDGVLNEPNLNLGMINLHSI